MLLEDIKAGSWLDGVIPAEAVSVIAVQWHGSDAVELTYKTTAGLLDQQLIFRKDEIGLAAAQSGGRPFDANGDDFRLVAEAQRVRLAGLFDPMLAVATSDVRPLPHQIRAVYEEMLPRTPLRFLLADDPGAGKTIMAGLYIKELLLRDDVKRCLIVAPGGLVEQWQDELSSKFGLRFELLTSQMVDGAAGHVLSKAGSFLIARMDQLARNEDMQAQLQQSEWDLVVVDEAHRMGVHDRGSKVEKTKRFQLGEMLGERTRHLLLMTATPHSGKEEDFQLFLSLLDRDRFAGRYRRGISSVDVSGVMRRMVKEDLLTFEGKPLFPERRAETVPYDLTALEKNLYERVTDYVREGMNRADKLDPEKRNTIGFALTVLQRRLASSPEAIHQSLVRRTARLDRYRQDLLDGKGVRDDRQVSGLNDLDGDSWNAADLEQIEDELLDSATAARTVLELQAEILELTELTAAADVVRTSGTDRKWSELKTILQDETLMRADGTGRRKLIIFTEHRDTLEYLKTRMEVLAGRPRAVQAIHGGVRRAVRRQITEEFTKNPDCQYLIATDAAGEGLNLQAAHLMVNYDLPWNPNRIEQRFGRIHRIGQTEVCRLWNLVASNTREGEVFERLLSKVEEQRRAYGGKVFDVLGAAFDEVPLRELLLNAVRYGDRADVRASMHRTIDSQVSNGLVELLNDKALARQNLGEAEVDAMRHQVDEARARRLQPYYVESSFRNSFARLGGRIARREKGRFEISIVPPVIRNGPNGGAVASKYERVTFDLAAVDLENRPHADFVAPGHPLNDAVTASMIDLLSTSLDRGTVLVSSSIAEPRLLVGVLEEVVDATGAPVARRFGYAYVDERGTVSGAGPAPYLDCVPAPPCPTVDAVRALGWVSDAEKRATSWIITNRLPDYLGDAEPRRAAELARTRSEVAQRLEQEIERLRHEAAQADTSEREGDKPRESSDSLRRKAEDLSDRLRRRLVLLDKQQQMSTRPPRVITSALVLPLAEVRPFLSPDTPMLAAGSATDERHAIDRVLHAERALGRTPTEPSSAGAGYDVLSTDTTGHPTRITVKAQPEGAEDFFVTFNEVITGKNSSPHSRLAMVQLRSPAAGQEDVRYVTDPFSSLDAPEVGGVKMPWTQAWARGKAPA